MNKSANTRLFIVVVFKISKIWKQLPAISVEKDWLNKEWCVCAEGCHAVVKEWGRYGKCPILRETVTSEKLVQYHSICVRRRYSSICREYFWKAVWGTYGYLWGVRLGDKEDERTFPSFFISFCTIRIVTLLP